ncbi:MAG: hypothetical protein PHE15_03570 [Dehalococcoidales bacterium]|nr:hypothetical protein [Dehalococcoidales bacterium]
MVINKKQGIGMLIVGLLPLTIGILIIITIPSWGNWLADYPELVLQQQLPAEASAMVQVIVGVIFGPLLNQVGEWMRIVGYFIGGLVTLIGLIITFRGITELRKK